MAETTSVPPAAVGWNVYMSSTSTGLTLQNPDPVPVGSSWSLPSTGVENNAGLAAAQNLGQSPDFYISISKQIQRG